MQPQDYGLQHSIFRPHQEESIQWCLSQDDKATGVIEASTGAGKTAYSKATSTRKKTIALCRTKNLQMVNYAELYGATPLYGRGNYDCIHPDNAGMSCADCIFAEKGMHKCPYSGSCNYLLAKAAARASAYATLNYQYWMTAKSFRERPPQVLFLDECHQLSGVVINFVGCTITQAERVQFRLPEFVEIKHQCENSLFGLPAPSIMALDWLNKARNALRARYGVLKSASGESPQARREFHHCERLGMKVARAMDALEKNADDWYIQSGRDVLQFGRKSLPGFVAKPLTAKYDFGRFFLGNYTTIAMSATVGNADTFCEELGIERHNFRAVPNQFPAETRPIYVLDCPAMGGTHKPDFEKRANKQAEAIAEFIDAFPSEWSGIIHVTRKFEERALCERLAKLGLGSRVWSVPGKEENYIPTDKQITQWKNRLRRVTNSLLVSCSFHEGYDGLDEKICISAKVPFPQMGKEGSYSRAWMCYNGKRYRQTAATSMAQQLGRTRRGRQQDYDVDGKINSAVAIADGALKMVKKYLPADLQDALVSW